MNFPGLFLVHPDAVEVCSSLYKTTPFQMHSCVRRLVKKCLATKHYPCVCKQSSWFHVYARVNLFLTHARFKCWKKENRLRTLFCPPHIKASPAKRFLKWGFHKLRNYMDDCLVFFFPLWRLCLEKQSFFFPVSIWMFMFIESSCDSKQHNVINCSVFL